MTAIYNVVYISFVQTGTSTLNFNFDQYSTKAQIANAISNLPAISGSGNDVSGTMLMIRDNLFMNNCPLRSVSQCSALVIYDRNADNKTAVDNVASVSDIRVYKLTN
jgi:hypothetical protein